MDKIVVVTGLALFLYFVFIVWRAIVFVIKIGIRFTYLVVKKVVPLLVLFFAFAAALLLIVVYRSEFLEPKFHPKADGAGQVVVGGLFMMVFGGILLAVIVVISVFIHKACKNVLEQVKNHDDSQSVFLDTTEKDY